MEMLSHNHGHTIKQGEGQQCEKPPVLEQNRGGNCHPRHPNCKAEDCYAKRWGDTHPHTHDEHEHPKREHS